MATVNPEILVWARKTAGLSAEEAAERIGLSEAKGASAVERLRDLEAGNAGPSRSILVRMAKAYRRPLVVFYMSRAPRKGKRGQDFRTLPADYSQSEAALIDALIRNVMARQSVIKTLLTEEEEARHLEFVGSARISDGVAGVVASIRKTLGMDHEPYYAQPSVDRAFGLLRSRAEVAGVFVLLIGNLGSHHTKISVEAFRGFALADEVAPFIVINDQDSRAAWSFTLLHELVHLWLGQTGISGQRADKEIEKFCNEVAGEFLLPATELQKLDVKKATSLETAETLISQFSSRRNLSSSMVAYGLFRRGAINEETWRSLSDFFREQWLQAREKQREKGHEEDGGPSYYLVRRHRVGAPLIHLVDQFLATGAITTSRAGHLLGVKAKNVGQLIEAAR